MIPETTTRPARVASTWIVLPLMPNKARTPAIGSTAIRTQWSQIGNGLRNVRRAFGCVLRKRRTAHMNAA